MAAPLKARVLLLALLSALLLLACGGGNDAGLKPTAAGGSPAAQPDAKTPAADPTSTGAAQGRVSDEPVAFQTQDGVTIKGHLYSVPGPKRQAVIFAHMYPNDQRAWRDFAQELAAQGIAALTFDFRGYGETGGSKDISKIDRDLSAALLLMKSRDYPLVYLVGASMGGAAALKVAAREDVAGLITVSAPLSFMGLDAESDVPKITERKLFLASRNESEGGGAAAQRLMQLASEPKELFVFDGSAHGTDLLQGPNASAFKDKVIAFIK